jgi:hypothetical protein
MRRSVGIKPLLVAVMLACLTIPEAALAQSGCFPMSCNDPNQSGPASSGQDIGDNDVDVGGDGQGGAPNQPGDDGNDATDGTNGANSAPGEPGTSTAGQPGQSGRPTPPAPPPAPSSSTRRSSSSSTRRTTTSSAVTTPTPDPLLEASPSPSPSPSPTPSESPSPTASPSDLVTALQDADPASSDGSMVPFFALVLGAILLVLYVRSRRPSRGGRGMHSAGSRRGGSHSLR